MTYIFIFYWLLTSVVAFMKFTKTRSDSLFFDLFFSLTLGWLLVPAFFVNKQMDKK